MKAISKLKDEARRFEQQEQWDKAINAYLQVLQVSEAGEAELELPLYNRIGDLYVRLGRASDAVTYYEQAAERYADAGLFNNAIALCNKALRYRPDHLQLMRSLGRYSLQQGFISDATHYYLGYAEKQFAAGDVDDAFAALDEFAETSNDPEIRELLGRRLQALGRGDRAAKELEKAWHLRRAAGQEAAAAAVLDEIRAIDVNTALLLEQATLEPDPFATVDAPAADGHAAPGDPAAAGYGADAGAAAAGDATTSDTGDVDDTDALGDAETAGDDVAPEPPAYAAATDVDDEPATAPDDVAGSDDRGSDDARPDLRVMADDAEHEDHRIEIEGFESTPFDGLGLGVNVERVQTTDTAPEDIGEVAPLEGLESSALGFDYEATDNAVDPIGFEIEREERTFEGRFVADPELYDEAEEEAPLPLLDAGEAEDRPAPLPPLPLIEGEIDPLALDTGIEEDVPVADYEGSVSLPGVEAEAAPPAVESFDVASEVRGADAAAASMGADDGYIDLSDLLSLGVEETTRFRVTEVAPSGDEDRDFAELLAQFKEKLARHVPPEDAAAHYDLGLAFREMGLLNEAIAEFQIAARASHMRLKVFEELGQCFIDRQQYNIAEKVLRRALDLPHSDELELLGVYYHLGRACEALGRRDQARDAYERVLGMDIGFQDASARLARL